MHGILLISNLFSVGSSYGAVCKELATRLVGRGWPVETTSAIQNRYLRSIDMLGTIWRTRHHYAGAQIDVFSGVAFRWAEIAAWELRKLGKPFILTLHGGNLPAFGAKYPVRVRTLLNSADCVVTPSRYLLDAMSVYCPEIRLIPNPIDVQLYSFRLRHHTTPQLLYLRALHKMYNPVMAVYALKQLSQVYPSAHLLIAGPDKGDGTLQELHEIISLFGISSQIALVGAVPKAEVPAIMSQADIFINTTNVDNTPISIIEAMACGLCIVSTNVGGIPYLLTHEHDALLIPPNDLQAMVVAVQRILTEPRLAEHLSRNARAKAEGFDWSMILPQWEELFLDVIQRSRS